MNGHASDGFDFKPFFDLVLGILFALLILVSAQMFFTQWQQPEASQSPQAQLLADRLRFMDRLEQGLKRGGFSPGIDRTANVAIIGLDQLTVAAPGGQRQPTAERLAVLGRIVADAVVCLTTRRTGDCGESLALRPAAVDIAVAFAGAPGAEPGSGQRLLALRLAASLFEGAHPLLDMRTPASGLITAGHIPVFLYKGPSDGEGDHLRFAFDLVPSQ